MSMKKWAVLSALHNYGDLNRTEMSPTPGSPPAPVHGVNIMLGGAMISGIILIIFIFCYCCHKTHRKSHQTQLPMNYWRDRSSLNMEIYTVEAQNCFHSEEFSEPTPPGPPPAYDVVVPIHKESNWDKSEEVAPPSYETAVKLQQGPRNGFV